MDLKAIIKETVNPPRGADERRFVAQHKSGVKTGYKKPEAEDATAGKEAGHKRPADKRVMDRASYDDAYADSGDTNLDREKVRVDQDDDLNEDEDTDGESLEESIDWKSVNIKGKDLAAVQKLYNSLDKSNQSRLASELKAGDKSVKRIVDFAHTI